MLLMDISEVTALQVKKKRRRREKKEEQGGKERG